MRQAAHRVLDAWQERRRTRGRHQLEAHSPAASVLDEHENRVLGCPAPTAPGSPSPRSLTDDDLIRLGDPVQMRGHHERVHDLTQLVQDRPGVPLRC